VVVVVAVLLWEIVDKCGCNYITVPLLAGIAVTNGYLELYIFDFLGSKMRELLRLRWVN